MRFRHQPAFPKKKKSKPAFPNWHTDVPKWFNPGPKSSVAGIGGRAAVARSLQMRAERPNGPSCRASPWRHPPCHRKGSRWRALSRPAATSSRWSRRVSGSWRRQGRPGCSAGPLHSAAPAFSDAIAPVRRSTNWVRRCRSASTRPSVHAAPSPGPDRGTGQRSHQSVRRVSRHIAAARRYRDLASARLRRFLKLL